MRQSQVMSAVAAGVCGVASVGGLGGCASYETIPAIPKNFALNDPNSVAMEQVMVTGLRWAASKYPPNGESVEAAAVRDTPIPFAVNLPQGATYRTYERVVGEVGMGAAPLSEETSHLPIYHVSYVRVRGDEAQVHIIRPVASLGASPTGQSVPQEIKLQLRGGLRPWHVIGVREWDVGMAEAPALNFYHRPAEASKPVASKPTERAYVPNPPANPPIGETAKAPATAGAPE
jgi:hypothetical protein